MQEFIWETTDEIDLALAERLKNIRKRKGITQKELSQKSNVSYGSLKLFEQTGRISLSSLTKLSAALGVVDEIKNLFTEVPYESIEEVRNERKTRP